MEEDGLVVAEGGSAVPGEEPTPGMTTRSRTAAPRGNACSDAASDGNGLSHMVSVPLALFPIVAIVGIAALGALAGPVWAGAGAALCVTALGMWVARVSQSLTTALVTGVIGVLATASTVGFYSTTERDATGGSQTPGISAPGAHLGGVDFSGADLRRLDLREADLRAVNFTGACLMAADFRGAELRDADFTNADVSGSLVDGAKQTSAARNWPTAPPAPSPCRR